MPSLFADIRAALARPNAPAQPQPAAPAPTRKRAVRDADPAVKPLSEAEIIGLLQSTHLSRQAAETTIASAVAARDEALEDDNEDALAAVEEAVRRAERRLEKIARDEPRLIARLTEVRRAKRCADFSLVRDSLVAAAALALPALKAAAEANEAWQAALGQALLDYPEARSVFPGAVTITPRDVVAFESDLNRFANTARVYSTERPPRTAADLIARAKATGERPGFENHMSFSEIVSAALEERHGVVTLVSLQDDNGRPVKAGAELTLDFDAACRLVQTGKARWADEKEH